MRVLAILLALLTVPVPAVHGDFDHYTFALTWQPGICQTEEGCRADQPHAPLIGLHGLWASLPSDLASEGVANRQWWSRGCDYYHHSDAAPPISAALDQRLEAVMPQFQHDLLVHEYDKHVQCFGFDPTTFFENELSMRDAVASSSFGRYLVQHAGATVDHSAVVDAFVHDFGTDRPTSLQLQCGKTADGTVVLTQLWMTIPTAQLPSFPQSDAFMATPADQDEDNCPKTFQIPAWS